MNKKVRSGNIYTHDIYGELYLYANHNGYYFIITKNNEFCRISICNSFSKKCENSNFSVQEFLEKFKIKLPFTDTTPTSEAVGRFWKKQVPVKDKLEQKNPKMKNYKYIIREGRQEVYFPELRKTCFFVKAKERKNIQPFVLYDRI